MKAQTLVLAAILAAAPFTPLPGAAQTAPPATVTLFPAAETTAAFAKGRPLIETTTYKVHASRREKPGEAEVHLLDTDIFHVLEGSATIVTGGELVDGRETAADERRAASIRGGRPQPLTKGDVIIVPKGTVHGGTKTEGAPFKAIAIKTPPQTPDDTKLVN